MLNTEKEFKSAVSALRKALREHYGKSVPTHTQCLELLAAALGATSYAQLRAHWADAPRTASAPVASVTAPAADASPKAVGESLRNDWGQFDLVGEGEDGTVVLGLDFSEMNGTVEDIFYCVAAAETGYRDNGRLVPQYDGETDVNWDGQETRRDERGNDLWEARGSCDSVPSSKLVLVPENFDPAADPDDAGKWPWRVRENLLDAYVSYIRRHGLAQALVAGQAAFADLDDPTLAQVAEALGFALHYGELEALVNRLKEN